MMDPDWWKDAVVYQVYLRSFHDANGDGIGDLAGLESRLDYLQQLGVDALWLNPCYTSPQRDHGYDVADYRSIDPSYGTVDDLARLLDSAHARGMKVLMDMVANHCSSDHEWFRAALASPAGSPERERFLFRDGRGENGELPPNNWQSVFGGAAWTRVADGQWYFHAFDSSQPDFNWRSEEVAEYFDSVLRFWFQLGVDGFRVDVAHGMVKARELADWPGSEDGTGGHNYDMWDQPEVHPIYRRWRAIGEAFGGRYFVGEIWVPSIDSLAAYLADDEFHQAFTFELLVQPWDSRRVATAIDRVIDQATALGSVPAWTLSNHDVHRTVTRYGQRQDLSAPVPTDMIAAARRRGDADLTLGGRRAKAAIMLQLALPGSVYLYQGEELGLPEVFDLADDARQDPIWIRSGGRELGRDGCRVPIPWDLSSPTFGFSASADTEAWLPQPSWFADYVAEQQGVGSTLALYRSAISARRAVFGAAEEIDWIEPIAPDSIAFRRGAGLCIVNFGDEPVRVPSEWKAQIVLLSDESDPGMGAAIPPNSAAWLAALETPAT